MTDRTGSSSKELERRSRERRRRIVAHRAGSFQEAEEWDLEFWQSQTPAIRLAALVAIRRDMAAIGRLHQESEPQE